MKSIVLIGLVVLVGVLGWFMYGYDKEVKTDTGGQNVNVGVTGWEGTVAEYVDTERGFSFKYRSEPDGFMVQEPELNENDDPNLEKAIVLINKKDYEELLQSEGGREGPPTINILVFNNPDGLTPESWAEKNSGIANTNFRISDISEEKFDNAQAIRFIADGLYQIDTVVVTSGSHAYLISGNFLEQDSQIRMDFKTFLSTLKFTPNFKN